MKVSGQEISIFKGLGIFLRSKTGPVESKSKGIAYKILQKSWVFGTSSLDMRLRMKQWSVEQAVHL